MELTKEVKLPPEVWTPLAHPGKSPLTPKTGLVGAFVLVSGLTMQHQHA